MKKEKDMFNKDPMIRMNDMDFLFILNFAIGTAMFLFGLFFDQIAAFMQWRYSPGFNYDQVIWVVFWGAYLGFNVYKFITYGKWPERGEK
jgi:hypothetical protein